MEQPEEGSDYHYLRQGHLTCTFLGGFQDFNGDFAAKMMELAE